MDIILIAGLRLPQRIWAATIAQLESLGHNPIPVALPGVDDSSVAVTLDDQIAAVLAAVDSADRPIVVGHSAACSLAWLAADRRPEEISRIILIGGFPASDGDAYADFFEPTDGVMGFPGWTPFEGADSADLDEAARERIASDAIPVPLGVSKGIVRLSDERRMNVPISVVCPEFTPDQARAWIDAGDVPELENANSVSFLNIDSGHWPMVSQPVELAHILDIAARGA
jgi:pimeloyl-ACP methyl ester carboxylesterase